MAQGLNKTIRCWIYIRVHVSPKCTRFRTKNYSSDKKPISPTFSVKTKPVDHSSFWAGSCPLCRDIFLLPPLFQTLLWMPPPLFSIIKSLNRKRRKKYFFRLYFRHLKAKHICSYVSISFTTPNKKTKNCCALLTLRFFSTVKNSHASV